MKFKKIIMPDSGVIFYERDGRIVISGINSINDKDWIIWDGGLSIATLKYSELSAFTREMMRIADIEYEENKEEMK